MTHMDGSTYERICQKGSGLIEVVIASSMLVTIVVATVGAFQLYMRLASADRDRAHAATLTQEAAEALQFMRDEDWDTIGSLSLSTPYQLSWTGDSYVATTSDVLLDGKYIRTLTLSALLRDGSDNVATSGTTDTGGRRVIIGVFASSSTSTIMSSEFLIHDLYAE